MNGRTRLRVAAQDIMIAVYMMKGERLYRSFDLTTAVTLTLEPSD